MDKFPEAFRRFESKVDTNHIKTWKQLQLTFCSWKKGRCGLTWKQTDALHIQAKRLGILIQGYRTREEEINRIFVKQSTATKTAIEQRRNIFSSNYMNFQVWQERTKRTTEYERRIINYLRNHPNATLREARGHRKKK